MTRSLEGQFLGKTKNKIVAQNKPHVHVASDK